MKILAFETSCDDTAVSIVEDGVRVLAHVKHSQVENHSPYGGVVPEIAARLHSEHWRSVMEECLRKADLSIEDIDALAITYGPGLQTSLLTGTTAASFLSQFYKKPLIPVHHVLGHINSVVLGRHLTDFQFPSLCLTVSGGHTDFYECDSFTNVKKVGQTIDDAAGEAFDKCAKMLGLGYPGGPLVSQWAEKGNEKAFDLPRIMLEKGSLNFSFSGLKAAVYRVIEQAEDKTDEGFIADVCASFQQCVVDTFLKKINRALDLYPHIKQFSFVGGVSANKQLREAIARLCEERGVRFFTTTKFLYSTDNAAMIGAAAYVLYENDPDIAKIQFVDADPRLQIQESGIKNQEKKEFYI